MLHLGEITLVVETILFMKFHDVNKCEQLGARLEFRCLLYLKVKT